jgi:hypothetical protein
MAALLKIGNNQIESFVIRLVHGRRLRRRDWFRCPGTVGAPELAFLIKHDLELLFKRHATEQGIDRLAARDAVVIAIVSTICAGEQMLHTGFRFRQGLPAEKALPSLDEHQTVEWFGRHNFSLITNLTNSRTLLRLPSLRIRGLQRMFPMR